MVTPYESYVKLAERLNALAPGDFPKKTLLLNSGAEAVENAVKIARAYTRRPAVICFEDAFHGRTLLTHVADQQDASLQGRLRAVRQRHLPHSVCLLLPLLVLALTYPACAVHCAHHLEDTFTRVVAAESVAAVIVEPVLGEGGFVTPPPEFLQRRAARSAGSTESCSSPTRCRPDLGEPANCSPASTSALCPTFWSPPRAWAAGCRWPPSRAAPRSWIIPGPESLGGTFGGNPLACEAALAVLDIMERDKLPRACHAARRAIPPRARAWQERWPLVGDVRGLGAMQAMELVRSRETREPAEETKEICATAWSAG